MTNAPNFELRQQDAVAFLAGLPDESVDLLVTDPAYESLEKHRAVGTTTRLKQSDGSSNPWFSVFPNARFGELFAEVYRVLKRDTHFYLMCDPETAFIAKPIAEQAGFKFWKPLVWDKCLDPNTPVWTSSGVRRIGDVCAGDCVATPDGREVAVLATRTTRAATVRVSLADGTSVVCSTEHRFITSDGKEVEAASLTPGTKLRVAKPGLDGAKDWLYLDDALEEEERVIEMPDPSECLFCGRSFDGVRAAAAHQARFCEAARSKAQMAEALGVAPKRLRRWMSDGRLPATWARALGLDHLSTGRSRLRLQNAAGLWFPERIALDYGLGKLIGLFAAEGFRTDLVVTFALHREEKHLINHIARMARSLKLQATVVPKPENGCLVHVASKFFSKLVGSFIGGTDAVSKFLTPRALRSPPEFLRGVFDGLIEGDGHWSHEEQRETYVSASCDLAHFVLRFARRLGWAATIRRVENTHRGCWRVRFDPSSQADGLQVVSVETGEELDLVDIAIDDPAQLYVLANGVVTHNCSIGMGYHYRARYEFVLFFEKGKRKLADLGIADVFNIPRIRGGYPAEKPPALSEILIRQSSDEGALVVDPFMGSGSTGVAALGLLRRFLGNDVADSSLQHARNRLLTLGGHEGELLGGPSGARGQMQLALG